MICKKLLSNSLDFLRWHVLFELLSLDMIDLEIFKAMGLEIEVRELKEIQKVARAFLEYVWLDKSQDNLTDGEYLDEMEYFMQDLFSQLAKNLGKEKSSWFYQWGVDYFQFIGTEGVIEFWWRLLLVRYAKFGNDNSMPALETIPKEKIRSMLQIVNDSIIYNEKMEDILETIEKKPRTEWDQRIYQTYEPDYSPLITVSLQIKFHKFQLIWRQIEDILTKEELEALRQWGEKVDDWSWPDKGKLSLPTLRIINF